MVTPKDLQAAVDAEDMKALKELEALIDAALKKDYCGKTTPVIVAIPAYHPKRVVTAMLEVYRTNKWTVTVQTDPRDGDSLFHFTAS